MHSINIFLISFNYCLLHCRSCHNSDRMFCVEELLFIILLAVFCLFLCLYRYNTYLDAVPKPPCKWSWIIGHTLLLFRHTDILKLGTEAAIKYGGLIRVLIPPSLTILITDNEVIRQFFKDSIEKAGDYGFLRPWLGTGLLTNNGLQWKTRRKLISHCFGSLNLIKGFIRVFDKSAECFLNELDDEVGQRSIDIVPLMKRFTLGVLCETAMGVSLSSKGVQGDLYIKSIQDICRVMLNRFKIPYKRVYLLYYLTKDYQIQRRSVKVIHSFFDTIFKEKLQMSDEEVDCNENRAFLDILIQFYKSSDLTKENIRDEVNTFMFGGTDTSAMGISFALYILAQHPDIQEKIIEEQIDIFGSLNSGMEVTYGHLQQMKYLELVILETLRLYPPVPFLGRKLMETLDIGGGIVLPKNLSVVVFIYGCHHHPKYFREPEKFIPERFKTDKILPYTFFPFGFGPRICIGKKFAMLEMKTTISKIVSRFKICPSDPEHIPQLVPDISMGSQNGVRISLEKR